MKIFQLDTVGVQEMTTTDMQLANGGLFVPWMVFNPATTSMVLSSIGEFVDGFKQGLKDSYKG